MRTRLLYLVLIVGVIAAAALRLARDDTGPRPAEVGLDVACPQRKACHHVLDLAQFIPASQADGLESYLGHVLQESDIDIRFLFGNQPRADMAARSVAVVDALRIGGKTGDRRGLLLNFDTERRQLKVEVGYGLEAYFPDLFVAYLVEHHAKLFFAGERPSIGLGLLVRILHYRIREATLGGDFDPTFLSALSSDAPLSGGAGVLSQMPAPASQPGPPSVIRPAIDAPAAGPTPAATFDAYLRLLAAPAWHPQADLFTEDTRQFLARQPMSRAYREFILWTEYRKAWKVVERDDMALLYFTGTPLVSPHLLRRDGGRWRLDIAAEVLGTREHTGGAHTWRYVGDAADPYYQRFTDQFADFGGYLRVRDGDNRALPVAGSSGRKR